MSDLYPVEPLDEIRIEFRYQRLDEEHKLKEYKLVHLFREPTAEDKKKYWAFLSRTKVIGKGRRNQEIETDYAGANALLWNLCIKRVEGYGLPEGGGEWKGLIDPEHKRIAVEKLREACGTEIDGEAEKN